MFWCHAVFLFKHILKIGLAGEAKITADITEAFARVGQQALCFFEFTAHDKAADIKAQLFLKPSSEVGAAFSNICSHIADLDRFVGVACDILDAVKYLLRHSLRDFILRDPLCKIYEHGIFQTGDIGYALCILTFHDIDIGKLVGLNRYLLYFFSAAAHYLPGCPLSAARLSAGVS